MSRLATLILSATIAAGSVVALAIPETLNSTIEGRAFAIDADTLDVAGVRVRLAEVDAPERDQTCTNASGIAWPCGRIATRAMQHMIKMDPHITCTVASLDRYGRSVATCENGDGDLGGRLVALGLAVVYPRYSKGTYQDRQEAAKAERLGMWSGEFVNPWDWRHAHAR